MNLIRAEVGNSSGLRGNSNCKCRSRSKRKLPKPRLAVCGTQKALAKFPIKDASNDCPKGMACIRNFGRV